MRKLTQQTLTGERALFMERDAEISLSTFGDGESPLKESRGISIDQSLFKCLTFASPKHSKTGE